MAARSGRETMKEVYQRPPAHASGGGLSTASGLHDDRSGRHIDRGRVASLKLTAQDHLCNRRLDVTSDGPTHGACAQLGIVAARVEKSFDRYRAYRELHAACFEEIGGEVLKDPSSNLGNVASSQG